MLTISKPQNEEETITQLMELQDLLAQLSDKGIDTFHIKESYTSGKRPNQDITVQGLTLDIEEQPDGTFAVLNDTEDTIFYSELIAKMSMPDCIKDIRVNWEDATAQIDYVDGCSTTIEAEDFADRAIQGANITGKVTASMTQ